MKNLLEQLYFGNIAPTEEDIDKKSKAYQLSVIAEKQSNKLLNTLTEEQKKEYNTYLSYEASARLQSEADAFIKGIRLGVRFLSECLIAPDFDDSDSEISVSN